MERPLLTLTHVPWIALLLASGGARAIAQHDIGTTNNLFRRGDVNSDGHVDPGDGEALLAYLNGTGTKPLCLDAADANDDGVLDVADAVLILGQSGDGPPSLPPPGTHECGVDPTPDKLSCDGYPEAVCALVNCCYPDGKCGLTCRDCCEKAKGFTVPECRGDSDGNGRDDACDPLPPQPEGVGEISCVQGEGYGVDVAWTNPRGFESLPTTVLVDGHEAALVGGLETQIHLSASSLPHGGMAQICVVNGSGESLCCNYVQRAPLFLRGDFNASGGVDMSDAIATFGYLFLGGSASSCLDAGDANDDDKVDLSDGIFELNYLFAGGAATPAPGPRECGLDLTNDGDLSCDSFSFCDVSVSSVQVFCCVSDIHLKTFLNAGAQVPYLVGSSTSLVDDGTHRRVRVDVDFSLSFKCNATFEKTLACVAGFQAELESAPQQYNPATKSYDRDARKDLKGETQMKLTVDPDSVTSECKRGSDHTETARIRVSFEATYPGGQAVKGPLTFKLKGHATKSNIDHTFKVDLRAGDINAGTDDIGDPEATPNPGATRTTGSSVSPDITVNK